jgi:putative FmdB family regulatory protein
MPSYSYICADCGPFEMARPLAEFDNPAPCPDCGAGAARALAFPSLKPVAVASAPLAAPKAHRAGCACCGARSTRGPAPDRVTKSAFLARD